MWIIIITIHSSAEQSQKAVSAYFTSEQILPFGYEYYAAHNITVHFNGTVVYIP